MGKIVGKVVPYDNIWQNRGRDYVKVGKEVYSINGMRMNAKGGYDSGGHFMKVMDVRWPVVVYQRIMREHRQLACGCCSAGCQCAEHRTPDTGVEVVGVAGVVVEGAQGNDAWADQGIQVPESLLHEMGPVGASIDVADVVTDILMEDHEQVGLSVLLTQVSRRATGKVCKYHVDHMHTFVEEDQEFEILRFVGDSQDLPALVRFGYKAEVGPYGVTSEYQEVFL